MKSVSRRALVIGTIGGAAAAAAAPLLAGCTPAAAETPTAKAPVAPATPASPEPTLEPTPVQTPAPDLRPRWPLTGALLKDPAKAERAVVAVKVPDNKGEHPQVGINDADIVFAELDGYPAGLYQSGTRLVPVFHSRYAADVGPVRSIRPVDVALLSPMNAIVGNTGAAGWTLRYFKKNAKGLDYKKTYMATKGTGSYSIDGSRVRTIKGRKYYDRAVLCHPKQLAGQSKIKTTPQILYFPFATGEEMPSTEVSGEAANTISVPWQKGDSYNMGYSYDKKKGVYLRSMPWGKHVLKDGSRVTTDNVLVILAKQHFAHHEPFHDITGKKGTFYYANGGRYVRGTWQKGQDVDSLFEFTLDDGGPLRMAPGRTFVELPHNKSTITIKA
ncbi:MAG: DUF3048 domain-containing protein [Propionibacteriaceae bacterium]|nr:DUF3048 domain-containing protein [Propionibacteriaceae bacterium]